MRLLVKLRKNCCIRDTSKVSIGGYNVFFDRQRAHQQMGAGKLLCCYKYAFPPFLQKIVNRVILSKLFPVLKLGFSGHPIYGGSM